MARSYTGIDIGRSALKMAVCDGGRVKKLIVEPIPEGLMDDQRIVSLDAMADFIKDVAKANGGVAKDVAYVLQPISTLVRRLEMPLMDAKEVALNLPFEFRDFIDQGKDRYFYDYAVLGPVNNEDGQLEGMDLLACCAPKDVINDLDNMLGRAGLRLRVALPAVAALQDIMETGPAAGTDCCVIDLAHKATRLHFFAKGLYDVTRTIELGGHDVDVAIADALGVDDHTANEYKASNFQDCLQLPEVLSVFDNLAVEVTRALNFYGFNNPQIELSRAYCMGGGAHIQGVLDQLAEAVHLELVPAAELLGQGEDDEQLPECAAAVGATLKAE
ncbi:MAG: pilus assembly protein PilM [Coriobacteriia bacterium]|nr:pilus assembly protein PilM [Coriobacteriia bacterium]